MLGATRGAALRWGWTRQAAACAGEALACERGVIDVRSRDVHALTRQASGAASAIRSEGSIDFAKWWQMRELRPRTICAGAPDALLPEKLFLTSKPKSLSVSTAKEDEEGPDDDSLKRNVLRMLGYYTRESELVRGVTQLYSRLADHATSPAFLNALGLEDDFRSQHAVLTLHMWIVLKRLRHEGDDAKAMAQDFYEHFQRDCEMRVYHHGVRVRVSKWLRELEDIFFGACVAYDKALGDGPDALGQALLKNVYCGEKDEAYGHALARYVRRELASLSMTDTESILTGQVVFDARME